MFDEPEMSQYWVVCYICTETKAEIHCHEWSQSDFSQVWFQVLFHYSADIVFYLEASHRDNKENIDLHESCRWWSGSLPYRFFLFSRDLAGRPLLSFPLLFLVGLGAPISCRTKDYGANLRILGCIIFKIQITTKFWLQ